MALTLKLRERSSEDVGLLLSVFHWCFGFFLLKIIKDVEWSSWISLTIHIMLLSSTKNRWLCCFGAMVIRFLAAWKKIINYKEPAREDGSISPILINAVFKQRKIIGWIRLRFSNSATVENVFFLPSFLHSVNGVTLSCPNGVCISFIIYFHVAKVGIELQGFFRKWEVQWGLNNFDRCCQWLLEIF